MHQTEDGQVSNPILPGLITRVSVNACFFGKKVVRVFAVTRSKALNCIPTDSGLRVFIPIEKVLMPWHCRNSPLKTTDLVVLTVSGSDKDMDTYCQTHQVLVTKY